MRVSRHFNLSSGLSCSLPVVGLAGDLVELSLLFLQHLADVLEPLTLTDSVHDLTTPFCVLQPTPLE